jgi:tetrahydromethanopterin S-methyltransferase subunit G
MNDDKQLKIDGLCLRAVRAVRAGHKSSEQRLDAICDRLNSVDAERVFWVGKEIGKRYEGAITGLIDAPDTYDAACAATSLMLAIRDYEIEILKDSPAEKAIKPLADLIRACRE